MATEDIAQSVNAKFNRVERSLEEIQDKVDLITKPKTRRNWNEGEVQLLFELVGNDPDWDEIARSINKVSAGN